MLNIGDFARAVGVSVRMLRHYDAVGVLAPTEVDPLSGYRRYDESLLPRAHRLVALRDLGFGLAEIAELLDGDATALRRALEVRRMQLSAQIDADTARLAEVERRLRIIEEDSTMEFIEKALPALTVLSRSEVVDDQTEVGRVIGPMFVGLAQQLTQAGDPPAHPGVAWYDAEGDRLRVTAGYLGKSVAPEGSAFRELAAQERAITTVYTGPMTGIGDAWQELAEHVRREGLTFAGPCRELYLDVEGPQESWVTELQQPVA